MRIEAGRMQENLCSSSTFTLSVGGQSTLMLPSLFIRPVFDYKKEIFEVQRQS